MPTEDSALPHPDDDEDADNCICGMEHIEGEVTSDEELPPTSGGMETAAEEEQPDNEDDVDGCELDFIAAEQTGDEELPVVIGGM